MAIRINIFDLAGNLVQDPEGAIEYATGVNIETAWPKGYMTATFQVRRSDIFADWLVRESYSVIIYDDATIIFDGRIQSMPRSLSGSNESITVLCVGWYVVLEERTIRKRWIDVNATAFLEWPANSYDDEDQVTWVSSKREGIMQVFAGTRDITRREDTHYREQYHAPGGTIRRVKFDWIGRCGERLELQIYNLATSTMEYDVRVDGGTVRRGSVNYMLVGSTPSFELRWNIGIGDTYDQNDYIHVSRLRIEANYESGHRNASNPTYTQGQLAEDVILLANQKGAQLSTDFSQLGDPGLLLDPFVVEQPDYAGPVIEKIAEYGDAALNTWGLSVWDRTGTSDNKPRVVFEARSTADYEYVASVSQAELTAMSYERVSDQLRNNVTVSYIDDRDITRYRTSANNPALADATSIANEYQRDHYINIEQGDAARADYVGARYIQYHKDRLTRGAITLRHRVELKGGGSMPVSQVRAGQRIKLLNTGEIFFIRSTSYNAEADTVAISPDLPPDDLKTLFLQRGRGFGRLAGR